MNSLQKKYLQIYTEHWKFYLLPSLAELSFAELCSIPRAEFSHGLLPVISSEHTEVRQFFYKGKNYFLKEYFFVNWKKHFKILRRGQRLAYIADLMINRGFLTPQIVGIGQCGKNRRVVSAAVEDARDIWQVLLPEKNQYRVDIDDGFLYGLGLTIGRFHQAGFFHGDLRWRNVLTRYENGDWLFYFIDNDRTKLYRFGIPARCRVKNLAQILFSGLIYNWPASDWQKFLSGYFEGSKLPDLQRQRLIGKVESKAYQRLALRKQREGK